MAKNKFDLQIQSTASDGRHTPSEIVAIAGEEGVEIIAMTDHDSVDGVEEAIKAAGTTGVRVIPGIEMSVEERGAHILGFGVDYKKSELLSSLEECRRSRIEGARLMVERLKNAGFVVDWEDVVREKTGVVIARPHIARAVLNRPENKEKLGGISTTHDFIEKHLGNSNPNFVERARISAKDAITLLHDAGGVAVWSHPAIHFREDYEGLERFLDDLIGWGIDGLEVFNPSHTEDDAEFVQNLAVRKILLRTAGSDFHEKDDHGADPARGLHSARTIGDYETYGFSTEDMVEKLDVAIANRRSVNSTI